MYLKDGGELAAGGLHDLLGDDAADGSGHGVQVPGADVGELGEEGLRVASHLGRTRIK